MSDDRSYASPAAFRRALTDKLKNAAKESRWTLAQLQRQMAYDRLLERLYHLAMRDELIAIVERQLERQVIALMGQNHIDPDLTVEVFVLEPAATD